jgi:hypothetical protein
MFRRLTEELAVSLIAWKRTRNTSAGLRSIVRFYRPKISLDAAQSFPHSQASTRERVMDDRVKRLVDRVASLNPAAGEIGTGMLAQLIYEARQIIEREKNNAQ